VNINYFHCKTSSKIFVPKIPRLDEISLRFICLEGPISNLKDSRELIGIIESSTSYSLKLPSSKHKKRVQQSWIYEFYFS
jgi:hypothetical protein